MNGICKILGILLFVRAFICAPTDCEPKCTLQEAKKLCLSPQGYLTECTLQCSWKKSGKLDENGYLSREGLNHTSKDPREAAKYTEVNWDCWRAVYEDGMKNGYIEGLCDAANQWEACVITLMKFAFLNDEVFTRFR